MASSTPPEALSNGFTRHSAPHLSHPQSEIEAAAPDTSSGEPPKTPVRSSGAAAAAASALQSHPVNSPTTPFATATPEAVKAVVAAATSTPLAQGARGGGERFARASSLLRGQFSFTSRSSIDVGLTPIPQGGAPAAGATAATPSARHAPPAVYIRQFDDGALVREDAMGAHDLKDVYKALQAQNVRKTRRKRIKNKIKKALRSKPKLQKKMGELIYKGHRRQVGLQPVPVLKAAVLLLYCLAPCCLSSLPATTDKVSRLTQISRPCL